MNGTTQKHHIDGMFVLLLFAVFACCVLAVLLTGAGSYRRLTERDQRAFDGRICAQYVASKVRACDAAGAVGVGAFDGPAAESGSTLFLRETVEGEAYVTRIYWYDGYVRELYAAAGETFSPEDGTEVLAAQALSFTLRDGLLTVTSTDRNGTEAALTLLLRCGGEAAS